jgi:hypothetical protein
MYNVKVCSLFVIKLVKSSDLMAITWKPCIHIHIYIYITAVRRFGFLPCHQCQKEFLIISHRY